MRKAIVAHVILVSLLLWKAAGADPATTRIRLAALPPTVRVSTADVLDGAKSVDLAAARGETESFQVVVTAEGGRLEGVTAQMGPLKSAEGRVLPPECVELFREAYVPVRHSAPRATCPPGLVADPLIPFKDPYTGEPIAEPKWRDEKRRGPRFGAAGFEVWTGQHQPLWVDVRVPREAAAGNYESTLRVTAGKGLGAEIPVRLTVWDFALPEAPTHENHFGGFERLRAYHQLEKEPERYARLEERYIDMLSAHRLNPPIPARLWPKPAADGSVSFDGEADRRLADFIGRYHVSSVPVPNAPFGNILGAHRAEAIRFYRTIFNYLAGRKWDKRAYLYMLDEPNDGEAYERVRQLGALVHEAAPGLRRLVVEQPYPQNPAWGLLDQAVDIWCPLFGFIHEASVERVRSRGNAVWSYTALVQSAPPYHPEFSQVKDDNPPYWELDFPIMSYRIAPWLNRRYQVTGLLYWSTVYWGSPDRNPWDDPGFRIRWNGEGALFYPGEDAGIEGPVASIRLKCLRDGMEDYEYFVLLEQAGGRETVDQLVRAAVPSWGAWNQDPNCLPELRQRLAREILRRRKS